MQVGRYMRELWVQKFGLIAALILASAAAIGLNYNVTSVFPPRLESKSLEIASATTQVVVDTKRPAIVDLRQNTYDFQALDNRALLLGNVMASPPVRDFVAKEVGISPEAIRIDAPVTPEQPRVVADGAHQPKTSDILRSPDEYRISIQANPTVPVLNIYAVAPDVSTAENLADAAVKGLRRYLVSVADTRGTPPRDAVALNQLGPAKGGDVDPSSSLQLAIVAFVLVFLGVCLLAIFLARIRSGWRETAPTDRPVSGHA
jgi:hypothetical protein